jgi:hypothetical protein
MASTQTSALGSGAGSALQPATEDERSTTMVASIARWLGATSSEARDARRRQFDSFPGDRLGNSQGLRNRLRELLGIVVAERAQTPRITTAVDALSGHPECVGQTTRVVASAVRWPAFTVGGVTVDGEGVFLRPRNCAATARIIVLPDADQSPEHASGLLDDGGSPRDHYALRLAEAGFEVLVMSLIDRQDTFAGSDAAQATVGGTAEATFTPTYTNQPHREWIHRPAFQMGRHIIGFEVQKVLAAVEAFSAVAPSSPPLPIGLFGFGEGGLVALNAAALEPRIRCTVISGYFQGHHDLLPTEPLYRNGTQDGCMHPSCCCCCCCCCSASCAAAHSVIMPVCCCSVWWSVAFR